MELDVIGVARKIQEKIELMERERPKLESLAMAKAQAMSDYEKALAITILKLQNGSIIEFEGEKVGEVKATNVGTIAKGICYQESLAADFAESAYKTHHKKLECVQAELCGYQSIFRHLETEA